MKTKYPLKH